MPARPGRREIYARLIFARYTRRGLTPDKDLPAEVSEAEAPQLKGVQLKACYLFMKKRYGDQAVDAALKSMSPEDQALIPAHLLDSSWYSYSAWRVVTRMMRVIDANAGEGFCLEMGKYLAEYSFGGVYRSLVAASPAKQVHRFNGIHQLGVRNVSDLDAYTISNDSAIVTYRYQKNVKTAASTCATPCSFWGRLLEMSREGSNSVAR